MRKVILNLAVTLDGFIEGPNGEIDWCRVETDEPGNDDAPSHFDRFLDSIDSILYGRISFDLWGNYQPAANAPSFEVRLWKDVHAKKKFVFSKKDGVHENATTISGDIAKAIQQMKEQPGKDLWLYGGADLITSFMNLGLIDEFLLAIHPVILGKGKPLFSNVEQRMNLQLGKIETSPSGVMLVSYLRA